MEKAKNRYLCILSFFIMLLFVACSFTPTNSVSAIDCDAKGSCLINVNTNEIIFAKNENIRLPMASTTKILTAILIIEKCDLSKIITVPDVAVGIEGSSIYLKKCEKIKIIDLLYGLMLRSGNDSAVALAIECSGSVESFAKAMNTKAIEIGATNSNFVNPHGLDADNHYTTAKDLALITSYALKNPIFKKISSTKMHKVEATNLCDVRYFKNKNKMLNNYDGAIGVKTGYTKKCGRCLVSAAQKDNETLACVVINCPNMWAESTNLLNYGFESFPKKQS